jgi:hypothetical protein
MMESVTEPSDNCPFEADLAPVLHPNTAHGGDESTVLGTLSTLIFPFLIFFKKEVD